MSIFASSFVSYPRHRAILRSRFGQEDASTLSSKAVLSVHESEKFLPPSRVHANFLNTVPNRNALSVDTKQLFKKMETTGVRLDSRAKEFPKNAQVVNVLLGHSGDYYKFFPDFLKSLVAQKHPHIHLSLVNIEGDNPASHTILKSHLKQYAPSLSYELMSIPYSPHFTLARQLAGKMLLHPQATHVMHADMDDAFTDSEAMTTLLEAIHKNPKAVSAFGSFGLMSPQGQKVLENKLTVNGAYPKLKRFNETNVWRYPSAINQHTFTLIKRDALPPVDYVPKTFMDDWMLFLNTMIQAKKKNPEVPIEQLVIQVPKSIFLYRQSTHSVSRGKQDPVLEKQRFQLYMKEIDIYKKELATIIPPTSYDLMCHDRSRLSTRMNRVLHAKSWHGMRLVIDEAKQRKVPVFQVLMLGFLKYARDKNALVNYLYGCFGH
ncbi:MAG: hypothetical protein ACKO37_02345 [Vampirovibrionales bacterium]